MSQWLREGLIKYREDITAGLENAPRELIGLLRGENFGKKIIRVSQDPTRSRPLIDPGHADLSVRRPCQLLGLSRATYRRPARRQGFPHKFCKRRPAVIGLTSA